MTLFTEILLHNILGTWFLNKVGCIKNLWTWGGKQEIMNQENHLLGQQLSDMNLSGEIQKRKKINK